MDPVSLPQRALARGGGIAPATLGVVGGILFLAGLFVTLSLRRPEPPTFPPSPPDPAPAEGLVGPVRYTVDASDPDRWRFFSFARGSLVESPAPGDWDLAFRRFGVIVNGGEGFHGTGGVVELEGASYEEVDRLPIDGYHGTRVTGGDSVTAAWARWYDYSFLSHLLSPKDRVYAVRTADGRYAKLEFLGYYCPGARPGCVTFRYTYQGAGGPALD